MSTHWEAWDVENLPGLTDQLKVSEMIRWWGQSMVTKRNDTDAYRVYRPDTYFELR